MNTSMFFRFQVQISTNSIVKNIVIDRPSITMFLTIKFVIGHYIFQLCKKFKTVMTRKNISIGWLCGKVKHFWKAFTPLVNKDLATFLHFCEILISNLVNQINNGVWLPAVLPATLSNRSHIRFRHRPRP